MVNDFLFHLFFSYSITHNSINSFMLHYFTFHFIYIYILYYRLFIHTLFYIDIIILLYGSSSLCCSYYFYFILYVSFGAGKYHYISRPAYKCNLIKKYLVFVLIFAYRQFVESFQCSRNDCVYTNK